MIRTVLRAALLTAGVFTAFKRAVDLSLPQ
jgi:hypothetical protein